ncbi:MAG: glutathione S-transferase [Bradymonadia bacterium]
MTPVLHQFSISHFCEKARWALGHAGVKYELRNHVPGLHSRTTKRLGERSWVPVLETADGAIQGSSAIVDYAVAHGGSDLNPADLDAMRVEEAWVDLELGEMIRSVIYRELIEQPSVLTGMWSQDGPWWSRGLLRIAYPVVRKAIKKQYVNKPRLLDSAARLEAAIRTLDARYAQGPYLVEGRFTRLDLTVAALLAPLARPPEHSFRWPEVALPPKFAAIHARHCDGPTIKRVTALYTEHRQP